MSQTPITHRESKVMTKKRKDASIITKKSILKALAKEPLVRGRWVAKPHLEVIGDCPVCAVGAVLRGAGLSNCDIVRTASDACEQTGPDMSDVFIRYSDEHYYQTSEGSKARHAAGLKQATELTQKKDYLSALTVLFEAQSYNTRVTPKHRQEMITFVKGNFPANLKITLPIKQKGSIA